MAHEPSDGDPVGLRNRAGRLVRAVRAAVRAVRAELACPFAAFDRFGFYPGHVVKQINRLQVTVQMERSDLGLMCATLEVGLPGAVVSVMPGAQVYVLFPEGDLRFPEARLAPCNQPRHVRVQVVRGSFTLDGFTGRAPDVEHEGPQ